MCGQQSDPEKLAKPLLVLGELVAAILQQMEAIGVAVAGVSLLLFLTSLLKMQMTMRLLALVLGVNDLREVIATIL